ncbi:MAG: hypothetical protein CMJ67_08085 [Planctomycetaceae bacterium]|nr:hypothetical protein [Planctomycetaceae bacterium]
MLPYRILSWLTEVYPFAALAFYIGLAMFTFAVCFLIPALAIVILMFSIFFLVPAVAFFRVLKMIEAWLARNQISRHRCPCCGEELQGAEEVDCLVCGIVWDPQGTKVTA